MMKKKDNRKYFIALNMIPNANIKALNLLINRVDEISTIFKKRDLSVSKLTEPEKKILNYIKKAGKELLKKAEKELSLIEKEKDINLITILDKEYPDLLKNIFDPPILLYVKGKLREEDSNAIGIVGSRTPTREGCNTAYNFARELAKNGITVVSGLALGIDSCAHLGVVENNGRTLAVLGSGLYKVYPAENKKLFNMIAENGAVISEFPLLATPYKTHFPRRNRIISGLSMGVVVIEAANRSGALITANFALEQGREVFAVPGSIYSKLSDGTNRLIREGAFLVRNIDDILEEFNDKINRKKENIKHYEDKENRSNNKQYELNEKEKEILNILNDTPVSVEYIHSKLNFNVSELESILMVLEINGFVSQLPGQRFIKL